MENTSASFLNTLCVNFSSFSPLFKISIISPYGEAVFICDQFFLPEIKISHHLVEVSVIHSIQRTARPWITNSEILN